MIWHLFDENTYPTNVDWLLAKSELHFYDNACNPPLDKLVVSAPTQNELLNQSYARGCGSTETDRSDGTRSSRKGRTFYLANVPVQYRIGSLITSDWTTYFHVYPNYLGTITIQYWRFYAFHAESFTSSHGGDWQALYVVLPKLPNTVATLNVHPDFIGLLDQDTIDWWTGTGFFPGASYDPYVPLSYWHANVFVARGSHIGHKNVSDLTDRCNPPEGAPQLTPRYCPYFTVQTTGMYGRVIWCQLDACPKPGYRSGPSGPLINLGEKSLPMNGQVFIQYSGLWGSPGADYASSGTWGPAYADPLRDDGLSTAWCTGMRADLLQRECFASSTSP